MVIVQHLISVRKISFLDELAKIIVLLYTYFRTVAVIRPNRIALPEVVPG